MVKRLAPDLEEMFICKLGASGPALHEGYELSIDLQRVIDKVASCSETV